MHTKALGIGYERLERGQVTITAAAHAPSTPPASPQVRGSLADTSSEDLVIEMEPSDIVRTAHVLHLGVVAARKGGKDVPDVVHRIVRQLAEFGSGRVESGRLRIVATRDAGPFPMTSAAPGLTYDVSTAEAAHLLGVTDRQVRNYASDGPLSAVKVGRRWMLNRAQIEARRTTHLRLAS